MFESVESDYEPLVLTFDWIHIIGFCTSDGDSDGWESHILLKLLVCSKLNTVMLIQLRTYC